MKRELTRPKISAGRIIGLLERYFIYLFVLLGSYEIIIFIVAMKGLARYNETKDKSFAEYFFDWLITFYIYFSHNFSLNKINFMKGINGLKKTS